MDCYFVLGNDAAVQIAETLGGSVEEFSNLMNHRVKQLGLKNTSFVTPHGLDATDHYTTAYELAVLTSHALDNPKFKKIVGEKVHTVTINGYPKTVTNTNELLGYLEGVNGVKTGFTNDAGRCLVTSCKRGELEVICVVLGADTKKIRTQDSIRLLEYSFENYEMVPIKDMIEDVFQTWKRINEKRIFIIKGLQSFPEVELEENSYTWYPILKEQVKDIKIEVTQVETLIAPVLKGTVVGKLTVKVGEEILLELELKTEKTVEKKEILDYILDFLGNYKKYLEYGI